MFLTRLFNSPATTRLDLDGLAVLELPASFHRDESRELALPAPRRLRRRPYVEPLTLPDQLTYFLPSHDHRHLGGREVPALLRVTLYAPDVPLAAPDRAYFHDIARLDYHYDGQKEAVYAQATPAGDGLYYAEERQTRPGFFAVKEYRLQHLILTDATKKVRLFLSVAGDELTRAQAEKLLRAASHSLVVEPTPLARYFGYVRHFLQHTDAIRQANAQVNLHAFNEQLAGAGLPTLPAVQPYQPGHFADTGAYFYGVTGWQEVYFGARLGYSSAPSPKTPPYFSCNSPGGHYLPYVNQWAVLQQGTPAGHELRLRGAASEPLWFPPADRAPFVVADLLREACETAAHMQRQPGYAPPPPTTPARWELPWTYADVLARPATRLDYRTQALGFGYPTDNASFQLRYVGQRTSGSELPQLVFTLEVFDGSPRYRAVAADACYLAVDAGQGGQLSFAVAGTSYQAQVEPLAEGHLLVKKL